MLPHVGDGSRILAGCRRPDERHRQTDVLREAGLLLLSEPIVLRKSGECRCEGDDHVDSDRPGSRSDLLCEARVLLHGEKIVLQDVVEDQPRLNCSANEILLDNAFGGP